MLRVIFSPSKKKTQLKMEKQGRNEIMLKSLSNHLVNLCVSAAKSSQHTGLFVLMHARAGDTLACLSGPS